MTSGTFHKGRVRSKSFDFEHVQLTTNWEDVMCPICLDFPHNSVLLQCSSYDIGCRPFMCDTDHTHSNCLDRFKIAYGVPLAAKVPSRSDLTSEESIESMTINTSVQPSCPLCRGEVTGWVVVDEARGHLNMKKRCCEEENCTYVGNYSELQKHAKLKHPNAQPSKIDPARQLDWENFQQSSEIIDVLSTIQSEVPNGVVLGDYVIEYGDDGTRVEFEDFHAEDKKWWSSCIFYQVLGNFRAFRNRRRSRAIETRRRHRRTSYDASNSDDSSVTSADASEYAIDEVEYVATGGSYSHRRLVFSFSKAFLCSFHLNSQTLNMANGNFIYECVLTFCLWI